MLIIQSMDAILAGATTNKSKDGTKDYFKVTVEINDEYATLLSTQAIYNGYKNGTYPKYSKQTFVTEFNPQYGSYKLIDILTSPMEK